MASSTSFATSHTKGKSEELAHLSSSEPTVRQQMSSSLWRMNATLTSWWSLPKLAFWRYATTTSSPPPKLSLYFISEDTLVLDSDVGDELLKGLSAAFTESELYCE